MPSQGSLLADRIGRLALVGWAGGTPLPEFEDLMPAGLGADAVLVVRRLAVASRQDEVATVVADELVLAARTAARPSRGHVDPTADAVLFADTAELLACYLLSLRCRGSVPAWVWTHFASSLPPPMTMAVIRDQAVPLAAVLALVDDWGRLDEVLAELDISDRLHLLTSLAARHHLWLRQDHAARASELAAVEEHRADPGSCQPMSAFSWKFGREGSETTLGRLVLDDRFTSALRALVRTLLGRRLPEHRSASIRISSADPRVTFVDRDSRTDVRVPVDLSAPTSRGRQDRDAEFAGAADRADHSEVEAPTLHRAPGKADLRQSITVTPSSGTDSVGPSSVVDSGGVSAVAERTEQQTDTADAINTAAGGVFYLVNCYRRLDLAAFGLADAVGWDVVNGLGRAALHRADALEEEDALWTVLAQLSGRAPDEALPMPVLEACERALETITDELELAPGEPSLGELLLVRGSIHVDLTTVEFVAPLDAVNLTVRRRALDADPGWVPALGRIVRFRFIQEGA